MGACYSPYINPLSENRAKFVIHLDIVSLFVKEVGGD